MKSLKIRGFDVGKRKSKYEITKEYLQKYINDWKSKNYFYYKIQEEIKLLGYVLAVINGEIDIFQVNQEEWTYIKDIGKAKKIRFGKYEYKF